MTFRSRHHYSQAVATPLYTRDILRLASSIPHLGLLDEAEGRSERASAVCGSRVIVTVRVDDKGRVSALGQEVRACALGQASAALMGRAVIGRSGAELAAARDALGDFLEGRREDAGDWPDLAELAAARAYPARRASIMLPFEAVAEAALRAGGQEPPAAASSSSSPSSSER